MSAVDRIRDEISHAEYGAHADPTIELWTDEAEALCDLADAAEKLRHPLTLGDFHDALTEVRQCRARLDGEDDREHGVPVTKEAPLAKGDVLASNPCEVTVTHSAVNDVGRREVWGRCGHCRIAHPIDWKLFERGRGPWVRVARAASDPEASR